MRELDLEVDNGSGFPIVNVVLGPTEVATEACRVLWDHGPATVREVIVDANAITGLTLAGGQFDASSIGVKSCKPSRVFSSRQFCRLPCL